MAAAVVAAKKQLRKELKRALAAMTKQQMQDQSAILTEKVELHIAAQCSLRYYILQVLATEEYRSSERLSVYLTMPSEVDTKHILEVLLGLHSLPNVMPAHYPTGCTQDWEVSNSSAHVGLGLSSPLSL